MITKEDKEKGYRCKGKGLHCPKCDDKAKCVDYVEVEIKEDLQTCYQCYGECKEVYQIKVINEVGKMTFEKVCSEECASEIQDELYHLHKNRANNMKHQIIQRLK